MRGLPYWPARGVDAAGGQLPRRLGLSNLQSAIPESLTPPPVNSGKADPLPIAVFDASLYGDGQLLTQVYAGAGSLLVVPRPQGQLRTYLLLINVTAASTIRIALDAAASAVSGIPLAAGGNFLMDAKVWQNDIHVFSPVAGAGVLAAWMNVTVLPV